MKKFLPFIILILGIVVVLGAFLFVKKNKTQNQLNTDLNEEIVPEVPFEDRPVVSLTPTDDGHWLTLNIAQIKIDAASLDYLLLYDLPDGRQQGVPGTVKLTGESSIERKLLLGSESSGKFRYDEGVEKGSIEIKFRDNQGKLVAKFATDFHLLNSTDTLDSADGNFVYKLTKTPKSGYFVVMETFGIPKQTSQSDTPYGIFSSAVTGLSGEVSIKNSGSVYFYDGNDWTLVKDNMASGFGLFIGSSD